MEQRYRPKRSSRPRSRFDVVSAQRASRLHGRNMELPVVNKGIIAVVLGGVLMLIIALWLVGDDFRIHDIQVQNNQGVPVAQIIGVSSLQSEHVLTVDLDAAAQRVDDLPGVDAVRITCTWRASCTILVQVSQALALWQGSGDMKVWVDRQGQVQRAVDAVNASLNIRTEDGDLPAIGTPMNTRLLRALNELVVLQPKTTRYQYSSEYGLMYTDARGWKVRLGVAGYDGAMREKLELVKQLSDLLTAKKTTPRVLDVRYSAAPYYMK
jgi:cell division septal protein FtsQ